MADRIILPRATDDNFAIVAGAEAYFYDTGTTSEQTVYSDEAGTVPVSQPLTADAEGVFAATFATSPVKVVVKDTAGVTLPGYPSDPHPKVPASGSSADEVSFSPITGNAATNVQAAIQNLTTLWNNVTTFGKSLIAASNASVARATLGLTLLDEDDMASDRDDAVSTQQATKAYNDSIFATVSVVTGSRSAATTYTNSTGRPMFVTVELVASNGGLGAISIDGTTINAASNGGGSGSRISVAAVVPAGSDYTVTLTAGGGSVSIARWTEYT